MPLSFYINQSTLQKDEVKEDELKIYLGFRYI